MTSFFRLTAVFCLFSISSLGALPVRLGDIDFGLEGFDGYQEGRAYLSTDEEGGALEIRIGYRGFGLDTISWILPAADLASLQEALANAAWWRSRLMEMSVDQVVIKEVASVSPSITYAHRNSSWDFDSTPHTLRFLRQGRDYALLLADASSGADMRKSGDRELPVFTLHLPGRELAGIRDMLSQENITRVLEAYAGQKAAVEAILNDGPAQ